MTWTAALEAAPDPAIREAILQPLSAHNVATVGQGNWAPLAVTVRDAAGQVVGGLWGNIWHDFLFVEFLATGAARGHGLGRAVMQLAEAEALRRGCTGIWLDTFSFQAPGFYAKLGFTECGRIADYMPGQDRIFLVKRLAPPS